MVSFLLGLTVTMSHYFEDILLRLIYFISHFTIHTMLQTCLSVEEECSFSGFKLNEVREE